MPPSESRNRDGVGVALAEGVTVGVDVGSVGTGVMVGVSVGVGLGIVGAGNPAPSTKGR